MLDRHLFCCLTLTLVVAAPLRAESPAVDLQKIAKLVRQLGAAEFGDRERAQAELLEIGEPALSSLIPAQKSADLEVAHRAHRAVRTIYDRALRSKSTGITFALIESGDFTMGSPEDEVDRHTNELQHPVRITRPFLLALHETTQAQYHTITGNRPSWFSPSGKGADKVKEMATDNFPVEEVTWFDAVEFCNRLSKRDGLPPYYRIRSIEREDGAIVKAKVTINGGQGYRLPTEAEWEYASRAGAKGPFGVEVKDNQREGNFGVRRPSAYGLASLSSLKRTTEVADHPKNNWGLCDMHGNVAEWCWDWYANDYYKKSPKADPQGPPQGVHRVLRGGSWVITKANCRSATRFWSAPSERAYYAGFRVARDPSPYLTGEAP